MQSFNHLEKKRKNLLKKRMKMKMNILTFHLVKKKTKRKSLRLLKRNRKREKKEKKHKRWLMFSHQKRLVY